MTSQNEVIKTLMVMGELYNKNISEGAARMYLDDLGEFSAEEILKALKSCRREIPRFPTASEIITRCERLDGRLSADEAWALIPRTEDDSVVWTSEIEDAYHSARDLLKYGDEFSARRCFVENYNRIVQESRLNKKSVSWRLSPGYNQSGREAAIAHALSKNRISESDARLMLPEFETKDEVKNFAQISEIKKLIGGTMKKMESQ